MMTEPEPSFHPNPTRPKLGLPPRSCDAHFHVFGPQARFPFPENRTYTPADAPKEKLFEMHRLMGIGRGVVVQAGAHGFDNSASADLIAARPRDYRGVALLPVHTKRETLKALDEQGFRGVRFNYMKHLGGGSASIEDVVAFSKTLAMLGWHLQIHMESSLIAELGAVLARSAVPVVIDHMGRVDASKGVAQKDFSDLVRLLETNPTFYVKVSGSERISRQPPPYPDAIAFARKLVSEFGDRVLWGTDWPHPNLSHIPDDGVLVDLLGEIAPDEAARRALLVDNPARFYRFE